MDLRQQWGGGVSKHLLLVAHCPSPNTGDLRDAVERGVTEVADSLQLRSRAPLDAGAVDVLWADGLIIGTTENFGAMAGRTKDFFERIYYPCLEAKQGLPVALYIRAGLDGAGTERGIEAIFTGLKWKKVLPTAVLKGDWQAGFVERCRELGMTVAAGLEAGIY